MSDPFVLLGLPRRPWLGDEVIRAAFQEHARRSHPDADGGNAEDFSKLNTAQAILASPASRLRVLAGEAAIPNMPGDIQLGFRTGELVRKVGTLCEQERVAGNVLARALLAGEALSAREELGGVLETLEASRAALDGKLCALDGRWPDVGPLELAALAAEYTFLSRWREQIRDARLELEIAFGKSDSAVVESRPIGGKRSAFPTSQSRK